MAPYIGRRMRRVEDQRLVTGQGRYAGDIKLDGLVHVAFARSPLPHALIRAIDTAQAREMPGVIAVWTAEDLTEASSGLSDWGPEDMVYKARP
jgi:carbon-monoxide dehydrogenase large subunit